MKFKEGDKIISKDLTIIGYIQYVRMNQYHLTYKIINSVSSRVTKQSFDTIDMLFVLCTPAMEILYLKGNK